VCGNDTLSGAGVLEWCFNEADAKERLQMMKAYPQFQDLSVDDGRGSQGSISEHTLQAIHKGQSLESVRR
jgi:2-oxo-4-hydroxy-4-carboxy--5-ureidoimidazoline (OHCU) decarboxylase